MPRRPAKQIDLNQSREWKMALDNLEQMHPRYLASLLADGSLSDVLERKVRGYFQTLARLQQAYPDEPLVNLQEMAQPEDLTAVNPNWQDEKPLTKQERALLKAYLNRQQRRQSNP